jgi:CheY-like chemotaxis protein
MDFKGGQTVNAGKRVLLVDDEQEVLCGESMWLTAAGFDTQPAKDGVEGLEAAIREQPDAIVLDVRMPRKDGLTVMTELQQRDDTKHIPVVMLSASLSDQQRALDAGASFFLPKPYVGKTLVAAVQAAVQHARERQPRSAAFPGDPQ